MPPRPTLPKPPSTGGAISVQVLNELANVARRKMQMSWAAVFVEHLEQLMIVAKVHMEKSRAAGRSLLRRRP
jgi:predicted nucleic acid-binding protein